MDRSVWDPIQVCRISDPNCTTTCYGQTLAKRKCGNRISEKSRTTAVQLLELLAQQPADHRLFESLEKIARLLLCRRYHQHQEEDQVQPLVERWHKNACDSGVIGPHVRNAGAESRQLDDPLYPELNPVDRTSTPSIPMDVEPATAGPQSIRMEQLRQRSVPFDVSPLSPARIIFGTPNADNTRTPVILRTLRQDDGSGRTECFICHDNSTDDGVYLQCERCRRSVHLGCMGDWLGQRSILINFNCPQW